MEYPGIDGFLGTRASITLDIVFLAMFLVLPVLGVSVYLVKYRGHYALHKRIQVTLGLVLLVAVVFFEIDMRFISGWKERASPSPYYGAEEGRGVVFYVLYVHLFFAISTTVLWTFVILQALKRFPRPPCPGVYSPIHIRWARLASIGMFFTAVTGWSFYWLAFVA